LIDLWLFVLYVLLAQAVSDKNNKSRNIYRIVLMIAPKNRIYLKKYQTYQLILTEITTYYLKSNKQYEVIPESHPYKLYITNKL